MRPRHINSLESFCSSERSEDGAATKLSLLHSRTAIALLALQRSDGSYIEYCRHGTSSESHGIKVLCASRALRDKRENRDANLCFAGSFKASIWSNINLSMTDKFLVFAPLGRSLIGNVRPLLECFSTNRRLKISPFCNRIAALVLSEATPDELRPFLVFVKDIVPLRS